MTDTAPVTQPFQAEVSELLHLMVHSVYSETDIFLRELISNASDACDKLRYEAIARPELIGEGEAPKIRIIPNKAANTLTVADSGIGMAEADIPKALERFGQIDSSLGRKYEGTGLGLPLSKRLAELHGGTLVIESAVGVGTRVTINFPAHRVVVDRAAA